MNERDDTPLDQDRREFLLRAAKAGQIAAAAGV